MSDRQPPATVDISLPSMRTVIVIAIAIVVLVLGFALGSQADGHLFSVSNAIAVSICLAVVIATSTVFGYIVQKANSRAMDRVEEAVQSHAQTVDALIQSRLSAYTSPLYGKDSVRERATELLRSVVVETDEAKRWLYYFGSAGLIQCDYGRDHEADQASHSRYRSAMASIMADRVPVTRFISLATARQYAHLPENVQRAYVGWVEQQILQLERNPNYKIYDVPDAPAWGSSTNTLVTPSSLVTVVGDGISALKINGSDVVSPFLDGWKRQFTIGKRSPEVYDRDRLVDYLKHGLELSAEINQLDTRQALLGIIAELINDAARESHDVGVSVVYIGSADLAAADNDGHGIYRKAVDNTAKTRLCVQRYICLLDKKDFWSRGPDTRSAYAKWLERQIDLLEKNPCYEFYHCPRAQSWGSSRSSIFTPRGYVDVIGNGVRGIHVMGSSVSRDLTDASRELFETSHIQPARFTANDLRTYLRELRQNGRSRRVHRPEDN